MTRRTSIAVAAVQAVILAGCYYPTGHFPQGNQLRDLYCQPCQSDYDCGGNGNFCVCNDPVCDTGACATACNSNADCPSSAGCFPVDEDADGGGGVIGNDCQPLNGFCNSPADAGTTDAGPTDAGPTDAGPTDAGPVPMDGGLFDAGQPDAGPVDAGPFDAGSFDAGPTDAGPGGSTFVLNYGAPFGYIENWSAQFLASGQTPGGYWDISQPGNWTPARTMTLSEVVDPTIVDVLFTAGIGPQYGGSATTSACVGNGAGATLTGSVSATLNGAACTASAWSDPRGSSYGCDILVDCSPADAGSGDAGP